MHQTIVPGNTGKRRPPSWTGIVAAWIAFPIGGIGMLAVASAPRIGLGLVTAATAVFILKREDSIEPVDRTSRQRRSKPESIARNSPRAGR